MPRKKQKIDNATIVKDSIQVEETSLRRSRRKLANDNGKAQVLKVERTILEDPVIKTPKGLKKKLKTGDKNSTPEFEKNSPDSADSGISLKDENYSLPMASKTEFLSSEKPKLQKNKKRKVDDSGETSISSNKNKKPVSETKDTSKNISAEDKNKKESRILVEPSEKEKLLSENNHSIFVDNAACSSSMKNETVLQVLTQHEFDTHSESETPVLKKLKTENSDNDSSSESDWEEVEDKKELSLESYNPVIPKDGVEITIDCPELNVRKRKKKQFDHMEWIRLYINRERKEHQLNIHKTHLLCLLAHGLFVNDILNSDNLKAFALSYLPSEMLAVTSGRKVDKANSDVIHNVVSWFCEAFSFENKQLPFIDFRKNLPIYFQQQKSLSPSEYNLMFIVFARTLGFKTRFCVSFYPVSHKAKNLLKKPGSKKKDNCTAEKKEKSISIKQESSEEKAILAKKDGIKKKSLPTEQVSSKKASMPIKEEDPKKKSKIAVQNKKTKLDATIKNSRPQRSVSKSYKMSSEEDGEIEDEDFVEETPKRSKQIKKASKKLSEKSSDRKVLSSDSEPDSPENCPIKVDKIVCWCEVFSKPDKQWISIECSKKIIDKPYDIEKLLPQPVTYILAYDNNSYIKDVTRRYCSEYMTSTVKLRADSEWWEETLEDFAPPNTKLDKEEEKKLDEMLENKPLPKTIGEFKNHPLYALKRHLLKFEAIYPPDAAPVGFIREEPVFARDNVVKLHSRETWVKEARVVRAGEEPYKIVKARPKWDRIAGVMRTDLPLEVFGFWQTNQYEPPIAVDGKVPRNEYGNVELFKPCMLPRGTVHLQIPGLNRVAKKLGIDCSPAVVGFDGHKGSIHPVFDGFVVCKEFKDTLLAAWDEEQENARKREEEKREKRIYGNWKKLIKGLLIRERIKLKYDVK